MATTKIISAILFSFKKKKKKTSLPIQPSSVLRFVYHSCRPSCIALLWGIFNGNVNKIDEFQMFSRWIMLLFHYLHQFKEEKKFSHLNSICIYTDRIRMIWFWRCKIFHKYSFNHFCFVFLLLFCSWNILMCGSFLAWKPPGPIYIYIIIYGNIKRIIIRTSMEKNIALFVNCENWFCSSAFSILRYGCYAQCLMLLENLLNSSHLDSFS